MSTLYRRAAAIVKKVQAKRSSVKTLTLSSNFAAKQKLHALVCETLKYADVLSKLMTMSKVPEKEWKGVQRSMLLVMMYDHLFGKGIKGGGAVKRLIVKHDEKLRRALVRMKAEMKVMSNRELLPECVRNGHSGKRYVRVNTLKLSLNDAKLENLVKSHGGCKDPHLPELLVFPPTLDLHDHELVQSGALILQDKASCFPARILLDSFSTERSLWIPGSRVIDACAAPGNKTSHLAAILSSDFADRSTVLAFDRDPTRLSLLQRRMHDAGAASIVSAKLQDFLAVDPEDPKYANVRAILLDPSCSGSGMQRSLERRVRPTHCDEARVLRLAAFQLKCLQHAFQFPSVERVSYSTCSIFQQENEDVVIAALQDQRAETSLSARKVERTFRLCAALPTWHRRGLSVSGLTQEESSFLVRVDPEKDRMNGFFVACFERWDGDNRDCSSTTAVTARKRERSSASDEVSDLEEKKKKKRRRKRLSSKRRRKLRERQSRGGERDVPESNLGQREGKS